MDSIAAAVQILVEISRPVMKREGFLHLFCLFFSCFSSVCIFFPKLLCYNDCIALVNANFKENNSACVHEYTKL